MIRKSISYIIPPLFYFFVSFFGRAFTSKGVKEWYPTITKPSFTPPGTFIGIAWTVIFILSIISMIYFLRRSRRTSFSFVVGCLYLSNGFFNVLWSYLFFVKHDLFLAFVDAILIGLSVLAIILLLWRHMRVASVLLLPYLLWVSFAAYLSYTIFKLN